MTTQEANRQILESYKFKVKYPEFDGTYYNIDQIRILFEVNKWDWTAENIEKRGSLFAV